MKKPKPKPFPFPKHKGKCKYCGVDRRWLNAPDSDCYANPNKKDDKRVHK